MAKHGPPPPLDMDALAAHLDRAWELLRHDDPDGAARSAEKAAELDGEDPEVLTLQGAIAAYRGEIEEALERYREAIAADPEFVAPMLYAAEMLLEPDQDRDEALRLIEQALEHAEEEDDYLDALLLKAEALVELGGREDEARAALAELPPLKLPEASFHLRAARTFLDLGDLDDAEAQYGRAAELDAESADAYHGLGLVREEREDVKGMVKAWLRVRELDLEEAEPPWVLPQEEFEEVAEKALAELPERIRGLLENVPILAADYPAVEIVAEGADPRMMGFFSGVPYPEKSNVAGSIPHLDCVFLYKRNIERVCRNREEIRDEIRKTLLHETGHFFGMSEEELDEIGLG